MAKVKTTHPGDTVARLGVEVRRCLIADTLRDKLDAASAMPRRAMRSLAVQTCRSASPVLESC